MQFVKQVLKIFQNVLVSFGGDRFVRYRYFQILFKFVNISAFIIRFLIIVFFISSFIKIVVVFILYMSFLNVVKMIVIFFIFSNSSVFFKYFVLVNSVIGIIEELRIFSQIKNGFVVLFQFFGFRISSVGGLFVVEVKIEFEILLDEYFVQC